jgi:hypothetical protein
MRTCTLDSSKPTHFFALGVPGFYLKSDLSDVGDGSRPVHCSGLRFSALERRIYVDASLVQKWPEKTPTFPRLRNANVSQVRFSCSPPDIFPFAFSDLGCQRVSSQRPEMTPRSADVDFSDGRDYPTEAYVEVIVTNHGRRAVQIVSTFVEYEDGKVHQITGRNLPIVLEPNCQVASAIQKEWLDDPSAQTVGVLDALGKRIPQPSARCAS